MRRLLAAFLALAVVAGAPGSESYQAFAQSVAGSAAEAGSSARAVPVLGTTGLSSPVLSLPPSALSLAPAALSAPAVAPQALAPAAALAVPVHAAASVEVSAVPVGPARVMAIQVPHVRAAAKGEAPAVVPALAAARRAAPSVENSDDGARLFDGSAEKEAAAAPVMPERGSSFGRAIRKGVMVVALSLGLFAAHQNAYAQSVPPRVAQPHATEAKSGANVADSLARKAAVAANAQAQAPPAAHADTVRVALPRPVTAEASVDRQGATVGDRIHLTVVLRNTSDKTITLQSLRAPLQEALPSDLELQPGQEAEQPLTLAPGESKTVVYEAIPFGSGTLTLDGGIAVVPVAEAAYPEGIEIVLPKTEITVATVLTPDWKQKGLRDIVDVKRGEGPDWMWLAAIPFAILLFVGVHRMVAARRLYPKLDAKRLSLVSVVETELASLKAESAGLDAASFYARYQELVTRFMVDFGGLARKERDARALERDLRKVFYTDGQIDVAARLAAQAEAARFEGAEKDASERERMIGRLQALIESVAGKAGGEKSEKTPGALGILALLPGAAGLTFGSPWALLLLIPLAAYAAWSWRARSRAKSERFAVSSSEQAPARRTLRERLAGLPRVLRLAAMGMIIVALARPMIGTKRNETYIPSTDTMVTIDLSGSMGGAKLQGVRDAVKGYVEEQRRGTENRVGMVTFSDNAYLDVKLTTDYDALIAHLKELEATNSTAIGKAMLTSIAHFLELNALELDGKADPRAAEVQRLLKDQGLGAALAYAKPYPDLMKTILQPERAKVVVLFTDGDSNSGIDPLAAADIAASLGVKVYGVGIAGPNESFNEATLRGVAQKTGAKFFRAGDAERMREVLLEISRMEKSPAKIVSSVSVKDYTSLLAMLALMLFGAELVLANTRLRTVYGLAFVAALGQGPAQLAPAFQAPMAQVSSVSKATVAPPPEVIEGNKLYNQGRFSEALKKYGDALERHPDVPEIYFNMADAYLRLGENEKADAAWAKYLALTKDPKRQSQTLFNLGNSAVLAGDGEKAIELYKEALRRDSSNQDAKWNLEALKQAQKEQQGQPKNSKNGKPGKQKGKPGDGKPGDGQGQPGDGQPGNGKPGDGQPQAKPGDAKDGADKLGQALGDQEKAEQDAARKNMTRKGSGVWGVAALPLAFAGQGLVFSSTAFLWVVGVGLPLAALLVAWGFKKRLAAAKRLSPGTAPKGFRSWWGARRFLSKSALALAAAGLIGLAAGDPRGGMVDERVNFGGKDIVVTVDGSYSMIYAEDGRMQRTQKELNEFITRLQGTDRVGLVVFAGSARTASPISIDYGNFEFKINRLDVEARGLREGSNLAEAVRFSARHFETAKKLGDRQRIMIVISDGDVPESEIDAAVSAATEHGVTVYAIGVGDPSGTRIKVPTVDGKGSEYLLDSKTGGPAVTRLNEAPLRKLAERTGGAYFRAGGRTSIDGILDQVSRLEKGEKGDVIKSARPVGVYLLWPALAMLLLDLLMPGRSLLKRGRKPGEKPGDPQGPAGGPGGGAMLGAALIPLGAWPQILPFAALATAAAAYIAADSWSGGAISRRIREAWQSRRRFVEKGVSADLIHLYDLREADERRLSSFVKGWQDAKEPLRETMIAVAAHDEALWREKLTAVYLSGAAPETLEMVLAALRRTARLRLEPLKPVTDRMSVRQAQISWMAHSDAEARVAALKAVAAGTPVPFMTPKSPLPSGFFARFKRGTAVAVLAAMLALTGASTVGTARFQAEQRAAAETATKIFYAEDLFVFTDRYVDPRIPEQVLPALKRWHESPLTAGDDFERALTILRESPDPKADNILVAIFRHAGVLPLTGKAETTLLLALIDRDSDALWGSMDELIVKSRVDAASARMLVKLVMAGAESGDDKAIAQLFRVLKSPNEQVRQAAAGILYGRLARDGGAHFFDELSGVQAKHAGDPMLQMWTASFAFRRLSEPAAGEADLAKAKGFLEQSLANAHAIDAARVAEYKRTPLDQEVEAQPSMVAMLLELSSAMQDGGAAAPTASAARFLVSRAATDLIKEGEKAIPGLHERLIEEGVVLPDAKSSYDGYYGRGYSSATRNYREVYKLAHLRAFAEAVSDMTDSLVAKPTKENAELREYAERAAAVVAKALETGAKAGMMEGGSAPETAAEQLLPVLRLGDQTFAAHNFLRALRAAGLAPLSGDPSSQFAYPEALDGPQLVKLRSTLSAIARSGSGWDADGKPRPLTWPEKLYLASALDSISAAQMRNYPEMGAPTANADEALAPARLSLALSAKPDPAFALQAEKALIERAAKGRADSTDAGPLLTQILAVVSGTSREDAALKELMAALKLPHGAVLAPAALARAGAALASIGEQGEKAFGGLKEELLDLGVRESESGWRSDLKQRHFRVVGERIAAAAAKAQAGGKKLNAGQLAARDAAKALPRFEALAAAAGAPAGDAVAEVAADRVNVVLLRGYHLFSGSDFNDSLRASGMMPGAGNTLADYHQTYSRAELQELRAWLAALAASGKNLSKTPEDLTSEERAYLAGALDRLDDVLLESYGVVPASAGPRTLLQKVLRPGEESLALTRLALELDAHPGDAAFALQAEKVLLELVALRPADPGVDVVLDGVLAATVGTPSEAAAAAELVRALKGPQGAALAPAVLKVSDAVAKLLGEAAEQVFPDMGDAMLKAGVRSDPTTWRDTFKLRHYRQLAAAIAKRGAAEKAPTAEQKDLLKSARTLLPLMETLAAGAGAPAGDEPGEIAAEILNAALEKGYSAFPGTTFNDKLREKGFMDPNAANSYSDHKQAYTREEVAAIRGWLKSVLAGGKILDGSRALDDDEKQALVDGIAAADEALGAYAAGKGLHAFAPLAPLALAALPGLAPWLLFALIGAAAFYLIWRALPADSPDGTEARESIDGAVLARRSRLELAARRMATAVNGGSFRSRFVGAGGTDFAEARPYQGEDLREVDWKTSAKKDELYAKKFELERDMPLMLVVDVSGSGRFGTTGTDKRAAIEDAAAVLALAASRSNVRVGLVLVSDRVEQVVPPRGGQKHAMMIVDAILKAQESGAGSATDLKPGLETAARLLRSRSMVAVLSDFIAPDFKDALGALSSRHDVRAIRVTDPAELGPLPDVGLLPVVDAETGATRTLDTSSKAGRAEAGAAVGAREAAIEAAFQAARLDPISLSTAGDPLEALEAAFRPKAKQPFKP